MAFGLGPTQLEFGLGEEMGGEGGQPNWGLGWEGRGAPNPTGVWVGEEMGGGDKNFD